MSAALEKQREKDEEFVAWAKKNQPPEWVRIVFVIYFGLCGILPLSAGGSAALAESGLSPTQFLAPVAIAFIQSRF